MRATQPYLQHVDLGSSSSFYDAKSSSYAEFGNDDVSRVVTRILPPGGRVLDVGCASGGLLRRLEGLAGYRAGLEISPIAAAAAAAVCDEVVSLAIDDPRVPFEPDSFDVVVCADILEHLVDPDAALRRVCGWLIPGGSVVISVPNIANWAARLRLLRGVWRYEELGTWDSGHLRFFTLESLEAMVASVGLEMVAMEGTEAATFQFPRLGRLPRAAGGLAATTLRVLSRWRPQLFGFELVCVARRPPHPAKTTTSA